MDDPSKLTAALLFKLFKIYISSGCFYKALTKLLKLYSISFFILKYYCFFYSSIISPSRSCCSIKTWVLNSISILASFTTKSSTAGLSSWIKALFNFNFWGLFISLNLMRKSLSRFKKIAIRSINFYRILSVLCASTIVGLPRVCLRLLIISLLRFLASCTFLFWPGFIM